MTHKKYSPSTYVCKFRKCFHQIIACHSASHLALLHQKQTSTICKWYTNDAISCVGIPGSQFGNAAILWPQLERSSKIREASSALN